MRYILAIAALIGLAAYGETSKLPEISHFPQITPLIAVTSLFPAEAAEEYIVIGLGGYNSCEDSKKAGDLTVTGEKVRTHYIEYLESKKKTVHWLLSCFWGVASNQLRVKYSGMSETVPNETFQLWNWRTTTYLDDGPTNPTQRLEQGYPLSGPMVQNEWFYDLLSAHINQLMLDRAGDNVRFNILVAGHSNGGYTGLMFQKTILETALFTMQLQRSNRIAWSTQLMDPISVACNQASLAWGSTACQRAPTEAEVGYVSLRQSKVFIRNYYQRAYTTLRSGAVPNDSVTAEGAGTVFNLQVTAYPGGSAWGTNAHSQMSGHDAGYADAIGVLKTRGLLPE